MSERNDLLRNTLIAITAATPTVGGPLSFLLDKYIPSELERKRNSFLQKLSNDIEELEKKCEICNFDTPEFQAIFARLLQASLVEYREEKLLAFRNILLQIVKTKEHYVFDQADFFSKLVMIMVPDQIKILHVFYQLDVKGKYSDLCKGDNRDAMKIISKLCANIDLEYANALLIDIMRYSIISGNAKTRKNKGRKGVFLTTLGQSFVDFIFNPIEGDFDYDIKF